jgi:hypothetical protein
VYGYDGGKKLKGRKRFILVDTDVETGSTVSSDRVIRLTLLFFTQILQLSGETSKEPIIGVRKEH